MERYVRLGAPDAAEALVLAEDAYSLAVSERLCRVAGHNSQLRHQILRMTSVALPETHEAMCQCFSSTIRKSCFASRVS